MIRIILLAFIGLLALTEAQFNRRKMGPKRLKKCDEYVPFVSKWICPEKKRKFIPEVINQKLSTSPFDGTRYDRNVKDCVKDIPRPPPFFIETQETNRTIYLEELCKMVKKPIWNLYENLNLAGKSVQHECIVVNTDWLGQDLYYANCRNPRSANNDKCQLDYSSRHEYRCIQSGFVRKRILVYCPDVNQYMYTSRVVPTTCSCRKCFHCEGANMLFKDLMAGVMDRFNPSRRRPKSPKRLRHKPSNCL